MIIKSVPFGHGFDWISQGFKLFRLNPLIWIVNLIILLAIFSLLSLVPLLGSVAAMLLQPVLFGGLFLGCRALDQGQELRVEHLFDGFRQSTTPLLKIGLFSVLVYLLLGVLLLVFLFGVAGLSVWSLEQQLPQDLPIDALLAVALVLLIGLAVSVPIAMATWFAPALVLFQNLTETEALKASFSGCLRNMLPFLLFGIVVAGLTLLALIPAGLGMLVLMPTLLTTNYRAYQDIFEE